MNICFPVTGDAGLDSPLSGHFGSAPGFFFLDTESGAAEFVPRASEAHEHGACRPLDAFRGRTVDVCVVGGIGGGALQKLQAAGIQVVRGGGATIRACLAVLVSGEQAVMGPESACGGHGSHGSHGSQGPHGHGHTCGGH
jgi:predicted Fe-Mo cluster-binding NifX family protein